MTEGEQLKLLMGFVIGTVFSGVCSALAWYTGARGLP